MTILFIMRTVFSDWSNVIFLFSYHPFNLIVIAPLVRPVRGPLGRRRSTSLAGSFHWYQTQGDVWKEEKMRILITVGLVEYILL